MLDSGDDDGQGSLFDTMRQDQQNSMREQGAKMKLVQKFGPANPFTDSALSTPGFGVETPNFIGAKSRTSAATSVASSGITSPLAGGQISPWILEAEALVADTDPVEAPPVVGNGRSNAAHAWGVSPAALASETRETQGFAALPPVPKVEAQEPSLGGLIEDEDELDQVDVFMSSPPSKKVGEAVLSGGSSPQSPTLPPGPPGPSSIIAPKALAQEGIGEAEDVVSKASQRGGIQYVIGETVQYWSKSHCIWMPAVVVERKSHSVYLIDKQGKGCVSKAKASELLSERESRSDPMLRALQALGPDARPSSAGASSSRGSSGAGSPVTRASPTSVGRIVRDDFSDDSDEEAPKVRGALVAKAKSEPVAPVGRIVRDDFSDDSDG